MSNVLEHMSTRAHRLKWCDCYRHCPRCTGRFLPEELQEVPGAGKSRYCNRCALELANG